MKSYPPWPARIAEPPSQKKGQVYVYFFGSKQEYGWVPNTKVSAYDSKTEVKNKKPDFKLALKKIEEYKETLGMGDNPDKNEVEGESDKGNGDENVSAESDQKRKRQPKRKFSIESDGSSSSPASKAKGKRKVFDMFENGPKRSKILILESMRDDRPPSPNLSGRHEVPSTNLSIVSDLLKSKDIEPSTARFGFLGLGIMGMGIVKNLINSGHTVNLWCLDSDDYTAVKEQIDKIKEGLVQTYLTPCDVMENSDIVFNCSASPETAKRNVFENCGVIGPNTDTLDGKGFVEMTGIDPQTSHEIAEAIRMKGGRYLEAQLQGSREEAHEGSLVILTAGDKDLYTDCQTCFRAMGKSSMYLGDVGVATKVYLILQLIQGIALVGLAEGLVLADRCGISGKDIINIFNMTNMTSPFLKKKADIIVNRDYTKVEHSIKNMQKDIRLALGVSDELMQPLMMASAANEVYKHSRKLGYDEHDCACIYMKARY